MSIQSAYLLSAIGINEASIENRERLPLTRLTLMVLTRLLNDRANHPGAEGSSRPIKNEHDKHEQPHRTV